MFERVTIHSLVFASVDGKIGLPVAIKVEFAKRDPAVDWLLKDSGAHIHVVPGHFARQSDV